MHITDIEAEVIQKVVSRSGMDCWFYLTGSPGDSFKVYDLEDECTRSLEDGLSLLFEGLVPEYDYGLTNDELVVLNNIRLRLEEK